MPPDALWESLAQNHSFIDGNKMNGLPAARLAPDERAHAQLLFRRVLKRMTFSFS